jgi:excisionase family DNA binding protein
MTDRGERGSIGPGPRVAHPPRGRGGWMTDPLLTAEQVAELLGMSRDWVYAEVRAGRIPHVRLGRYVRFLESSIAAWVRENEAPVTHTPRALTPRRR